MCDKSKYSKKIYIRLDRYIHRLLLCGLFWFFTRKKNRLFILSFVFEFVFEFALVDLPLFSVFIFFLIWVQKQWKFFGRTWFSMPLVVISFRSHFGSVLSLTNRLICVKEEKRKVKNKNNKKQIRFGLYHAFSLSCYRLAMF